MQSILSVRNVPSLLNNRGRIQIYQIFRLAIRCLRRKIIIRTRSTQCRRNSSVLIGWLDNFDGTNNLRKLGMHDELYLSDEITSCAVVMQNTNASNAVRVWNGDDANGVETGTREHIAVGKKSKQWYHLLRA